MEAKIIQLGIIAVLSLIIYIAVRASIRQIGKENWKREVEKEVSGEKPHWKVIVISTFIIVVSNPFIEELFCRGPLFILFSGLSRSAWVGIYISAVVYSALHAFKREKKFPALRRLSKNQRRIITVLNVIYTFFLGILCGWITVKSQCLWWAVLIHSVNNLISPSIINILVALGASGILAVSWLIDKIKFKKRDKKISELIGSCKADDLKPFDLDSEATRMKDGEMKKSCLSKDDIKK